MAAGTCRADSAARHTLGADPDAVVVVANLAQAVLFAAIPKCVGWTIELTIIGISHAGGTEI